MLRDFIKDLQAAKPAEDLVLKTLSNLTTNYTFTNVSNQREYFYKGDILATAANGEQYFLEVKNDSRIADTGNVLCEYQNYIKDSDYYIKGNMFSDYDFYCIVSQQLRKIYIIDFSILQANYTRGKHKIIPHWDQDTYCYLLPLTEVERLGGLIATIDF